MNYELLLNKCSYYFLLMSSFVEYTISMMDGNLNIKIGGCKQIFHQQFI